MLARRHIPNALTLARIAAVPLALVVMAASPSPHLPILVIFVAASLTDFLDGYLARKWQVTSPLGAMLDPIADKLLVTLMLLWVLMHLGGIFIPVTVILLRELYISGLREFLAARGATLPVSKGGKLKTMLQMLGITCLLVVPVLGLSKAVLFGHEVAIWSPTLLLVGMLFIWVAAATAFISAVQYTRASWKYLT